jgi:EmrB/QacA subfamily drug resistance transporter
LNTKDKTGTIDYNRKWYVMAAVGMGIFLATIDGSIVNVALRTIENSFSTDFPTVQWVVLAYLLTITTLMLSIGRLADMVGKKSIYTGGFIIFTIGSVLCGTSTSIHWLIGFRVFQAIGAAMIMALGMAIITESFPAKERGRALGVSGAIVSVGIVIGPTLGGLLISALSWHWIFFVNLPVGIIGTLMVIRFVPNIRPFGEQRFDYWGAVTLFVSLLCLLIALTDLQQIGEGTSQVTRVALLLIMSIVFLILFIFVELRSKEPMIDLHLFKNRLFSTGLITGFLTFICISGTTILTPFYLQIVLGYDTLKVGLLLAVVPVTLGITAPLSGSLSDRYGTRPITVTGLIVLLFGYYAMSTLTANTTALGFVLRFMPIGIGMGIFQSPNNSAIMGSAPKERLGIVSGMLAITRSLGQTTGVAVLGAVWAARTFLIAGLPIIGSATELPPSAQVNALSDTFILSVILIGCALAIAIVAWAQEKRRSAIVGKVVT